MKRFDDDPGHACAWGRWRIGQALNEPVLHAPGERCRVDHPLHERVQQPDRARAAARATSRLRLVSDAGGPVSRTPDPRR